MFHKIHKAVSFSPKLVLVCFTVFIFIAAWYGSSVFSKLTDDNGFVNKGAESYTVFQIIQHNFSKNSSSGIILFQSRDSSLHVTDSTYKNAVTNALEPLRANASQILTYYNTGNASFVSKNKLETYASVTI